MTIDFSNLSPVIWIITAVILLGVAIVIIRFFWQHLVKYLVQGCVIILGIIALLVLLHYLKVF
jgi:hypothetical protein